MRRLACFSGFLVLGLLIGCNPGVPKEVIPPLVPVTGKVMMDGKPAEKVSVTFVPAQNNPKGNPSSGSTDAEGAYKLTYRNGEEGIPVGDYVVVFSKLTQPDGSPIPEGQTAADVQAVEQIPERFRLMENPLQTVSVPEGGKTFDFELQSK